MAGASLGSATMNMCGHAILCAAFPRRYTSSLPLSPLIGAVGALVDDNIEELTEEIQATETERVPCTVKGMVHLLLIFVVFTILGITVLSLWVKGLRYDIWPGLLGGTVLGSLVLAQDHPKDWEPAGARGFLVRLSIQAIQSGLIILSGHALLVILSPLVDAAPVDYVSSLPFALLVGVIGGGILFCMFSAIVWARGVKNEEEEKKDTVKTVAHYMGYGLAATARGVGISLIGVIFLHAVGYTGLDLKHAAYVGAVGGTLMGCSGVRLEIS
ncbi:hypothetical protein B0H10DRAFT_902293 [Mycena sp. CBHHK59/15]|nr:hypothetical protein B0H10DRAFT_902293 [Mycena sp. CBHHK59/15]